MLLWGLVWAFSKQAYDRVTAFDMAGATTEISDQDRELAQVWEEFSADVDLLETDAESELIARNSSYASAFQWTVSQNVELYSFVIPIFLFWDALAMMLVGMALYKAGVLQAQRSRRFYINLMVGGFASGLLINGYEISEAYHSNFHLLATFPQLQATYHLGRLGMALGYIGMLGLVCQAGLLSGMTSRLAAVGRMALTNYLMHSLICAILFTGMGLGLLGLI
jgi:Predicted membrane protein